MRHHHKFLNTLNLLSQIQPRFKTQQRKCDELLKQRERSYQTKTEAQTSKGVFTNKKSNSSIGNCDQVTAAVIYIL